MHVDDWSFHHPAKIFSGTRCIANFFRLHVHDKDQILIITTRGALKRGYIKKIQDHIQSDNVCVWDQVKPNPDLDDLDRASSELRDFKASSIIALGGGSVLDTAKTLSITLAGTEDTFLHRHFRNKEMFQPGRKISLTAIPTTSGSGAEVTPFATIWDSSACKKYSLSHKLLYPDNVLLKPELCISLPLKQTLYSGLDLISHALESLWNVNTSPISRGFALQALNLANRSFSAVMENPQDMAGRKDMQNASLLAGMAISQTRTAIAHSISYPLTARLNIPHGLACSFTLPELIRINIQTFKDHDCLQTIHGTLELLNRLDLPREISEFANRDKVMAMVQEMINPDRAGNYTGMITTDELSRILEKSLGIR